MFSIKIPYRHCDPDFFVGRSNLFILLIFILISSCSEGDFLNYNLTEPETKLCLSGYICPDSTYIVLSLSQSYSDFISGTGRPATISDSEVSVFLMEDNIPFDTLVSQSRQVDNNFFEHYYVSRKVANPGKMYTIYASYKDYKCVTADTYLPTAAPFHSNEIGIIENVGYSMLIINLFINDLPENNNYYLLPKVVHFSNSNYYEYFLLLNDPLFDNYKEIFSQQVGKGIFFSDKLVQGKEFPVRYAFILEEQHFSKTATFSLFSISEDYYKYELSRHIKLNSQYDANSNPVTIYSNVEGGYGIFMGFSESKYTVEFDESY